MTSRAEHPSPAPPTTASTFTAPERDLQPRFRQDSLVPDRIMLRTWRVGPNAGQPKLPPAVQSMISRGLVEVRVGGRWPAAHFTAPGLVALRRLAQDCRPLDPTRYTHARRKLGLDAEATSAATPDEGATSARRTTPDHS